MFLKSPSTETSLSCVPSWQLSGGLRMHIPVLFIFILGLGSVPSLLAQVQTQQNPSDNASVQQVQLSSGGLEGLPRRQILPEFGKIWRISKILFQIGIPAASFSGFRGC